MTVTIWLSACVVCALGAMSPGPSLAVVIRNTVSGGERQGIATAWSHALGVGFYALATTFGLAAILARYGPVFIAVSLIGAVYLAWLGIQALRHAGEANLEAHDNSTVDTAGAARQGFLIAFLNPKVGVFLLAVFSQLLSPTMNAIDHSILAATALAIDGFWYSIVVCLISRSRWMNLLRTKSHLIDRAMGIILIMLAIAGVTRLAMG